MRPRSSRIGDVVGRLWETAAGDRMAPGTGALQPDFPHRWCRPRAAWDLMTRKQSYYPIAFDMRHLGALRERSAGQARTVGQTILSADVWLGRRRGQDCPRHAPTDFHQPPALQMLARRRHARTCAQAVFNRASRKRTPRQILLFFHHREVPPRDLQRETVQQAVGGQHTGRRHRQRLAIARRDLAARLLHKQGTRREIPWR